VTDFTDFIEALEKADDAAFGDSNDLEIELLQEVRDIAMNLLGIQQVGRYKVSDGYCNMAGDFGRSGHTHVCHEAEDHPTRHVCSCGASWLTVVAAPIERTTVDA
jgi:hypothetical protein